jgi:N-acetyl-anhydromuramyl-L-alanine amidase AmpD
MVLAFALLAPAPALAAPPSYYPPLDWIPAARSNYDVGRTAAIRAIVIHETDGSYTSAVNWFLNPRSRVSSHYIVRAWGGGITQLVAESDTAYHARNSNPYTIGIEHEFSARQGIWHTDAQYRSSALLTCAIARRYGIPTDRAHIVGHNELPDTDHSDPGPTWNWNYYMSLVNACSWQRVQPVARAAVRTVANHGYVPTPSLQFNNVSDEVALLQWDLVYLGFMDADEVAGGGSRFGPLTQDAVTAFQQANGVEATGAYGDQTAAALVQSILADPGGVPALDLDSGDEHEDVRLLQSALQRLGYMDVVTGYYGDITTDAVTTFQKDNGIYATGMYGPLTRMALASRIKAAIAQEAAVDETVAVGEEAFTVAGEALTWFGLVMFDMLVP